MDEGTFGEEEIKLAVESSPSLGDRRRVTEHTDSSLYLGQVSARYDCRRLVIDAHLYRTASKLFFVLVIVISMKIRYKHLK